MILSLEAELLKRMPIDAQTVKAAWSLAWADGNDQEDVEIQSLLIEKNDSLDVCLHVGSFRKLLEYHLFKHAPITGQPKSTEEALSAQLDADKFAVLMKQLKYDQLGDG